MHSFGSSRTRSLALATSLAVMLLGVPAKGHVGVPLKNFATVTVDGVMSFGEYDSGSCVGPNNRTFGGKTYTFTICESNDEVNDYYAVTINDMTHDTSGFSGDNLAIFFDNTHDGVPEPCATGTDDHVFAGAVAPHDLGDGWICRGADGFLQIGGDSAFDGDLAIAFDPDTGYTWEFSHPLNTGQSDDYALETGDTVGFCFTYDDVSNGANPHGFGEIQFPDGCFVAAAGGSLEQFGDVRKVTRLEDQLERLLDKLKDMVATEWPTCPHCPFVFNKLRDARILVERVASAPRTRGNSNMLRGAHGMAGAFINELSARHSRLGLDSRTVEALIAQARSIQNDINVILGDATLGVPR
jgi:hypothetical protein